MKGKTKKLLAMALILMSLMSLAATAQAASHIGTSRAKSIALKRAGLKSSAVRFTKAHKERDDGRWVYEIDFRLRSNRRVEYDFEIDARTGRILEWDRDYDDDDDWDD